MRADGFPGVLPIGRVISEFGPRRGRQHQGLDIAAPAKTPIRAVSSGRVMRLWRNGQLAGYGNTVLVAHADGTAGLYAHLHHWAPALERAYRVRQGEIIGYVGRTEAGQSSARAQAGRPITPHLHLEIHQKADPHVNPNNPKRINPEKYLQLKNLSPFDEHV